MNGGIGGGLNRLRWCTRDLRGPRSWTPEQLQRKADFAIVHPAWGYNPMPEATTLVHTGPSFYLSDGKVVGEPGSLLFRVATEAMAHGYDILPTRPRQGRVELWRSADGTQRTYAINIARREVAHWLARVIAESNLWAKGFELDYWSQFRWLWDWLEYRKLHGTTGMQEEDTFWDAWDAGLLTVAAAIRALRPDVLLLGHQFHNGYPPYNPMKRLNGRFVEDHPKRWMPLASHEALFKEWLLKVSKELPTVHVIEMAEPDHYSLAYKRQVVDWCEALNLVCSWGRDDWSLVGRP